jgi:hypothetical protein
VWLGGGEDTPLDEIVARKRQANAAAQHRERERNTISVTVILSSCALLCLIGGLVYWMRKLSAVATFRWEVSGQRPFAPSHGSHSAHTPAAPITLFSLTHVDRVCFRFVPLLSHLPNEKDAYRWHLFLSHKWGRPRLIQCQISCVQ